MNPDPPPPPPKTVTVLALISKVVTKQDKNNTFYRINTCNQFSANINWCSDQNKLTLKYTCEKKMITIILIIPLCLTQLFITMSLLTLHMEVNVQ